MIHSDKIDRNCFYNTIIHSKIKFKEIITKRKNIVKINLINSVDYYSFYRIGNTDSIKKNNNTSIELFHLNRITFPCKNFYIQDLSSSISIFLNKSINYFDNGNELSSMLSKNNKSFYNAIHGVDYFDSKYSRFNVPLFIILIVGTSGKTTVSFILSKVFTKNSIIFASFNNNSYNAQKNLILPRLKYRTSSNGFFNHLGNNKKKYKITMSVPDYQRLLEITKFLLNNGVKLFIFEHHIKNAHSNSFLKSINIILLTSIKKISNGYSEIKQSSIIKMIIDVMHNTSKKLVIYNNDEYYLKSFEYFFNKFFYLKYSIYNRTCHLFLKKIVYSVWGTQIVFTYGNNNYFLDLKLIGKHNLYNALAAIGICLSTNIKIHNILEAIEGVENIPDRLEKIDYGQNFNILLDYTNTPESIELLIKSIYQSCYTKILLLCGGRGEHKELKNRMVGKNVIISSKKIFITTGNPRWFTPSLILREMIKGLPKALTLLHSGSSYDWLINQRKIPIWFEYWLYKYQSNLNCFIIKERGLAIRTCLAMANKDDVVLLIGKGKNDYIELTDIKGNIKKYLFNDYKECISSLRKISYLYEFSLKTKNIPWRI
mmetsp:Transcript_24143/g.38002  ORF Transcript_24143/g.38002 Transcript_24143/m.38002 type:complete len:598 (+) Transcript_24143:485-2278(+)